MKKAAFSGDLNKSWGFNGEKTQYLTHNIHRYPAKFIPQIAKRLIEQLTVKGDNIIDPFCGSGTALLEAKLAGRDSTGVDLNPVAILISRVKTTPMEPDALNGKIIDFLMKIQNTKVEPFIPGNKELIDYWYYEKHIEELGKIFRLIKRTRDAEFRNFLLVGFSNIQKDCSRWLMSSSKPCRDPHKKIPNVFESYVKNLCNISTKNKELWGVVSGNENIINVLKGDTRRLSEVTEDKFKLALFSPPYVTSYHYVDLHKLSIMWLENIPDLNHMIRNFIGSTSDTEEKPAIESPTALEIVRILKRKKARVRNKVESYFKDMSQALTEIDKTIEKKGRISLVIGNTKLRGVDIKNAHVMTEILKSKGYTLEKHIKRPIPNKLLPSSRNPLTGKFVKTTEENRKVYPHEYILIFKKQ